MPAFDVKKMTVKLVRILRFKAYKVKLFLPLWHIRASLSNDKNAFRGGKPYHRGVAF